MNRRRVKGFLFFEIMVAVSLMGIAIATILGTLSAALSSARASQEYLWANFLLSQKLFEIQSSQGLESGIREGTFKDNPRYVYRIEAQEILGSDPQANTLSYLQEPLLQVTILVSWQHRRQTKGLSAVTYVRGLATSATGALPP